MIHAIVNWFKPKPKMDVDRAKILSNGDLLIFCPACKELHIVRVDKWKNNGSPLNPSVYGVSICIYTRRTFCHFLIRAGHIYFFDDSSHDLRDKAALLPAVAEWFKPTAAKITMNSRADSYVRNKGWMAGQDYDVKGYG